MLSEHRVMRGAMQTTGSFGCLLSKNIMKERKNARFYTSEQ